MQQKANPDIAIMVLAGGRATRMGGGDKCLLSLAGKPILSHILERLGKHKLIALNANDNENGLAVDRFADFSLPIFSDIIQGGEGCGPLGGILSGMEYFSGRADNLMVIAGDTPFIPHDLLARFLGVKGKDIVFAKSLGRYHPTISLWNMGLRGALAEAMDRGVRKIDLFTNDYGVGLVDYGDKEDVFFNVNSPEDLERAERMVHAQ